MIRCDAQNALDGLLVRRCSLAEEHAENYKEAKEQCGRALQFMKQEIDSKGSSRRNF